MRIEDKPRLATLPPKAPAARTTPPRRPGEDRLRRIPAPSGSEPLQGEQGIGALKSLPRRLTAITVPTHLRLGMVVGQPSTDFAVSAPLRVGTTYLEPGETYRLSIDPQGARIQAKSGAEVGVFPLPLRLDPDVDAPMILQGKRYRGALEVMRTPASPQALTVVNDVGLEDYLKGVLPAEMVTGWPSEALKVQAVAARTYAAANAGRRADQGFDLFPTVSDQVYKGMDAEAADTTAAVEATHGEVMRYQGALINALFFSSSGGSTDDAQAVWGLDLPYIKPVKDPDDSPNRQWQKQLGPAEVQKALGQLRVNVGAPRRIAILERTPGGRARWLQVTGDRGTARVDANQFRLASGLKSTMFQLVATKSGWRFDGSGYGHGLGMSQWGARSRALQGQDYRQILSTYYTGITLDRPADPPAP